MIRLFVGIKLENHITETLYKLNEKTDFQKASWIIPKNIHLTLKFLGWSREESTGKIKNAVRSVTDRHKPFSITVEGLGAFPTAKKARIFWAGVNCHTKELLKIQDELEDSLQPLGFKKEKRPYHPHVTIARLRIIEDVSERLNIEIPSLRMEVNELNLFQSKLTPKGAVYSVLENFSLKG